MLQRSQFLVRRLEQGRMSGDYSHLLGSKDLLEEVKDEYDDLAKRSNLDPAAQES